ncbi:DUF2804 family protein [Paenibacillus sp. NEAU-GSW1]|nr:DUF2804 domain-containing protein [Paenibacillus sp. NEAU-GSW1]MUT68292.1 DUF2804 family protein [Paenibacillus sp. NEAU-GSW1]
MPVSLCNERGELANDSVGWSRHPLVRCNVKGNLLRKKKWNYWCVTGPELLFSATISHLDYAAVMFVYVLDLKTKQFAEETWLIPLGVGCHMPEDVASTVSVSGKKASLKFEETGDGTRITVSWKDFGRAGDRFEADVRVMRPEGYESLNVVVPWSRDRFQFTSKQPALPASGNVAWGNRAYTFSVSDSYGCLDFGRGIWPYQSTWNWAAASGSSEGRLIGLNFGGQWTDGTGQNENGVLVNGRLHKQHENIIWTYDQADYMRPWTLRTEQSDRVALTFTPLFERVAATRAIIIQSEVHQMIGHFDGHVELDDGERAAINGLLGWAEDHSARW